MNSCMDVVGKVLALNTHGQKEKRGLREVRQL